jgi:hypothetical protein
VSDSSNLTKKKRGHGLDNNGTPITSEPKKFISSTSCRVGDSNSIPQLTLSISADSARQQAAIVEVLEQLAAYEEETVQYTVAVEGLEQNITNTNSNTTTNTDEIDMELQLGVILGNILVSSTPIPTPHEVVSETPAFLVQLNIADRLDQPDTTTLLEGLILVQT